VTAALYSELGFLCIAVMLTIAVRSAVIGSARSEKNRLFTATVFCIAAASLSELIYNLSSIAGGGFPRWVMYAINFVYFMMIACSSCCWFFYTCVIRDAKFMYRRGRSLLCLLPFAALTVLLTLSCFTDGCIFYLDAADAYRRGPLYILQPILSYGYVLAAAVTSFITVLRKRHSAHRKEYLTLLVCTVLATFCGAVEYFVPSVPVLSAGAALALLYIYLDSLVPMISLDPLTGIPNRRDLLVHLSDEAKYLRHGDRLHFLFIDVDAFKQINDIYGHGEGDRILRQLASGLKAFCLRRKCYCARYGGDELAVVQVLREDEDILETCFALSDHIASLHIRAYDSPEVQVSIGHAAFLGDGDTISELISRADRDMYRVKKEKREADGTFS